MLRATVGSETYFRRQQALPFAPNVWGLPAVRDASALGEVRVVSRSQPLCPSLDVRAAAPVFHLARSLAALVRVDRPQLRRQLRAAHDPAPSTTTTRAARFQQAVRLPPPIRRFCLAPCLSVCVPAAAAARFLFHFYYYRRTRASVRVLRVCVCLYAGQLNRRERERAICPWHARLCRGGLWTRRCAWANSKRIEAGFLPALLAVEVGKLIWFRYGAELETHA